MYCLSKIANEEDKIIEKTICQSNGTGWKHTWLNSPELVQATYDMLIKLDPISSEEIIYGTLRMSVKMSSRRSVHSIINVIRQRYNIKVPLGETELANVFTVLRSKMDFCRIVGLVAKTAFPDLEIKYLYPPKNNSVVETTTFYGDEYDSCSDDNLTIYITTYYQNICYGIMAHLLTKYFKISDIFYHHNCPICDSLLSSEGMIGRLE